MVAAVLAVAVQGASVADVLSASMEGYVSTTGVASVDGLLERGGLKNMLETVALVVCALAFAGIMEASGMLDSLARAVLRWAHGTGGLVVATAASAMGLNVLYLGPYSYDSAPIEKLFSALKTGDLNSLDQPSSKK